jgi:alpha-1,2-mannosyltransferase
VAAAAITGFFLCRLPWWGISWLNHPEWPRWIGRVLQNADTFGCLAALALLWWALHLKAPDAPEPPPRHTPGLQQPLLAKETE